MKFAIWKNVCGALMAALVASSTFSATFGQGCGCASGGSAMMSDGVIYEGMAIEGEIVDDAKAKLMETDDPTKVINLSVIVHEKAIVTINGEPTVTMGTKRPYIVRGLSPKKSYTFVVEGLYKTEQGAEYYAKEEVKLDAGQSKEVVLHVRRRNRAKPVAAPVPAAPAPGAPAAAK